LPVKEGSDTLDAVSRKINFVPKRNLPIQKGAMAISDPVEKRTSGLSRKKILRTEKRLMKRVMKSPTLFPRIYFKR